MKLVGDFLARFERLTPPHDALKRAVANAVHDVVRAPVSPEHVSIQNGVAFVKVSSIVRNKIHLERGRILEHVFSEIPKARDTLRDVR